ncbi:MAG: 23S rRNA (pseudouridine(1915)-N(3))-methyltransferase RlmH [Bacillota bacterium]
MKINLVTVGDLSTDYLQVGVAEFKKRLNRYLDLNVITVAAERLGNNLSQAAKKQIKEEEAERIIKQLDSRSYSIALDNEGKHMTSKGLAKSIGNLQVRGYSEIDFIIGGTLGLHQKVRDEADYVLTLSNMTFTHEMVQLILLEQIYRAFKIINGETYHR